MTSYTKIPKPSGTSYTPIGVGFKIYNDPSLTYNDTTVQYDGAVNAYTKVTKAAGTAYTKITKPS